ncbi:unnamed protein product, partial [Durusdinium trenchii]
QVHVTYPFVTHGCARAGVLTPSPLRPAHVMSFLDVSEDNTLVLSAEPNASWWIDASSEHLRVSSKLYPHTEWCICADQPQLYVCKCGAMHIKQRYLVVNRGLLQGYDGLKCLQADQTLNFERCPAGSREKFLWYFDSGNCFFGFDLTNTAEKRWTATSEAETSKLLRLGNFAFKDIISPDVGLFQIYLDYAEMNSQQCLHANMSKLLNPGYEMQISNDCRSAFVWRGAHLVYFHLSDTKTSYYVQIDPGSGVLIATTKAIPGADDKFEITSEGKLVPVSKPTKCLQAKKVETVPLSNGLRSLVASPSSSPEYSPCTSYGEFSGDGEYYQVCRGSPLLQLQDTIEAHCEVDPDDFSPVCGVSAHGYVLMDMRWPSSIPVEKTDDKLNGHCSAKCA